jgi:hypothetical protein
MDRHVIPAGVHLMRFVIGALESVVEIVCIGAFLITIVAGLALASGHL